MSNRIEESTAPDARMLGFLFGAMYFLQGITEPTAGLVAQPFKALLKSWQETPEAISGFAAILAQPWSIKPLYGLLSDFVPILGSRRRGYLILTSGIATLGFGALCLFPPSVGAVTWLLMALLLPTIAVAFNDVVVDALMVEEGQPRGLTGRLQSIQWAAIYSSQLLTGVVGGIISGSQQFYLGFGICGLAALAMLTLAIVIVRDPPRLGPPIEWRGFLPKLMDAATSPVFLGVCAFVFLWSFNPFSDTVQYLYMTQELGFSEEFFGTLLSVQAIGCIAGCLAYAVYCRRVPLRGLLHLSIAMGIASTVCYAFLRDEHTAPAIVICFGFTYMTGMLVQLDLAARVCPPGVAATMFALIMSVSNLGTSTSTAVGGWLYQRGLERMGAGTTFQGLVALGALCTAGCWLVTPYLRRTVAR